MTEVVDESDDLRKSQFNEATVLLYPFREMRLDWLDDFKHSFRDSERTTIMVRVMDCLMAHALLHEDPFLEEAVVQISQKFQLKWNTTSEDVIAAFEVAHHIFKTICLTAKFPSIEADRKEGLLKVSSQRIMEIEKAAKKPEMKLKDNVAKAARTALDCLQALRKDLASRTAFVDLMDAMKELFFTVSTRSGVSPPGPDGHWFDTFVCCEGCPCCARLRTGPTIFLRDMEKAKIIDCVMICAVTQDDALMRDVTTELLLHHYKNFMESPALDDIGRQIQNGMLFYCRNAIYDTLGCIQHLTRLHASGGQIQKECAPLLERSTVSVLWVKNELKDIRVLSELVPYLDRVLITIEAAHPRIGRAECRQDMATLEGLLTLVFRALSAPEYHLAVHSRDVFVGKPADMKCASPACPGATKDLLKCSGCDVTYYCSSECQKADWEKHKNFCHEIESRRARPTPIPSERGPIRCIKPAL